MRPAARVPGIPSFGSNRHAWAGLLWEAAPPVTAAVNERDVQLSYGEGGVAVTVRVMGVMVRGSAALASGASAVLPPLRTQTPTW